MFVFDPQAITVLTAMDRVTGYVRRSLCLEGCQGLRWGRRPGREDDVGRGRACRGRGLGHGPGALCPAE